jgi:parallel beta-helix repeat protein
MGNKVKKMDKQKRAMGVSIAAIVVIGALVLATGVASAVIAVDRYVGPSETYTTIQSAEDAANPYDTIIVRDGIYTENVDVDVDYLTIRSENGSANCIVKALSQNDHVFDVVSNRVNITGFTVRDATGDGMAGILLDNAWQCTISDNYAMNNFWGIYLREAKYNDLIGNIANWNEDDGIELDWYSDSNNLTGNTANWNGDDGIDLDNSQHNNLTGNTANWNGDDGIELTALSNYNNVSCNLVYHNTGSGFYLTASSTGNTIENNNIVANGDYNFDNDQDDNVIVKYNYWGTTSPAVIEASINENPGTVDFEPFLTAPAPCAPEIPVSEAPILTPLGLILLVSLLSTIAAVAIVRKRH